MSSQRSEKEFVHQKMPKTPKIVVITYYCRGHAHTAMGPIRAFGASSAICTTFSLAYSIRSKVGIAVRQAPRRCSMQLLISSAEYATKRRRAQRPFSSSSKARQKVPGFCATWKLNAAITAAVAVAVRARCTHDS